MTTAAVRHVAVIDIGKTNARATLFSAEDESENAQRAIATRVRDDGRYPHFDVAFLWDFICESLAALNSEAPVDAIAIAAHGASGAFIEADPDSGEGGLALPVLDYEFTGPDELAGEYEELRPDFPETLSPRLPVGLNLGAQIFWQEERFPQAAASAAAYVTYPQYWAWRLSGVAATEMSSLGCHTDLWDPRRRSWSSLVEKSGWQRLLAPLRSAFDVLGHVRPSLAARLGLQPQTKILCGVHDSSAALLPHLIEREPPFTVVSTGTWTIILAVGGAHEGLDPRRDTLAYVTPFGDPVPAARFMGGREFERLVNAAPVEPSDADTSRVIGMGVMALPSFAPGVGPFPDHTGQWTHDPDSLQPGERSAAASLYLALMTAEAMACADAGGPVVVEGPFAANRVFCGALAAITGRRVFPSSGTGGTSRGAARLVDPTQRLSGLGETFVTPLSTPGLADYVRRWRAEVSR
jgi:sugar (pentulose or hexulose) kinase